MKQKTFLKILIVSMVLVLSIIGMRNFTYASITNTTNTADIVVEGIEAGVTVSLYQLVTVNYSYTYDQPESETYSWVSAMSTWLASNTSYSSYANMDTFSAISSEAATTFYSAVAAAIKGGTLSLSPVDTATATGTSVTFANQAMGYYLVLVENGTKVYEPTVASIVPTFNNTTSEWDLDASGATVTEKGTEPTVYKYVTDTPTTADSYGTSTSINFTIKADVPTYSSDATSKEYYISDLLSSTLTLDTSSIKVYGNDSATLDTSAYTLTTTSAVRPTDSSSVSFLLEFDYDQISSYSYVTVTYTATLDNSTSIVTSGNTNTAYLDYSNNQYSSSSSYASKTSTSTVYSYAIEITKVDASSTSTTLPGAQFNLQDKDGNALYFVQESDGVYYLATSSTGSVTLETDTNGKLYIYGLAEGTYYLQETKAPDGYNLSTAKTTITLADTNLDGVLDGDSDGIYTETIRNKTGFSLPVTGGAGIAMFIAIGIVLIGLGVIVLIIPMRKKNQK